MPPTISSQLAWGYGVIFPDCDWSVPSAEWDQAMVADARTMRSMGRWLSGLFRYWRGRNQGRDQGASEQAVSALKRFLRPEFDVGIPLHVTLGELEERVAAFTQDQMGLLDIVDEGQDLLDMEPREKLDVVLAGGLEKGQWCFFHDLNNQAGYFGAPDPDALALLESCSAARVPLTRNCRNTRQILEWVQSLLDFPPKRISFARIGQFKGLENEAVMLVDLPRPTTTAETVRDHYVGMSRARSLLVAIFAETVARRTARPQ